MRMHDFREKLIAEKDARIAELTAEVANLRDALRVIAENESWRSGNTDQAVARNALKDGCDGYM